MKRLKAGDVGPLCSRPIVLFFPAPTDRVGSALQHKVVFGGSPSTTTAPAFASINYTTHGHGLRHVHQQQQQARALPYTAILPLFFLPDRTHCTHTHRTSPHILIMKTAAIFALLACAANAFILPTPKVSQVSRKIRGVVGKKPRRSEILACSYAFTRLESAGTFYESSVCTCWASVRPLFSLSKRPLPLSEASTPDMPIRLPFATAARARLYVCD